MNFATPQNVNLETEASIAPQYRRKYNSCEPIQNWLQNTVWWGNSGVSVR